MHRVTSTDKLEHVRSWSVKADTGCCWHTSLWDAAVLVTLCLRDPLLQSTSWAVLMISSLCLKSFSCGEPQGQRMVPVLSLRHLAVLWYCTVDVKVLFLGDKTHASILNFLIKVKIHIPYWFSSVILVGSLEAVLYCMVLCMLPLVSIHYSLCSWVIFISTFNWKAAM